MTRNTLSKCIASCFLVFICFFSHFTLAASMYSVDDIQGLETMKLQEKDRAEQLVSQIDTAEDPEQIVRELEIIQNNIQAYNLQLERLRNREVAIPVPAVTETITEAPDTNNSIWFWKMIIIILIVVGIFSIYNDGNSSTSSSSTVASGYENVVQTELPRRTFAQSTSVRTESLSQPSSQSNQTNLRDLVSQGVERLTDPNFLRSQDAQDGKAPGRR